MWTATKNEIWASVHALNHFIRLIVRHIRLKNAFIKRKKLPELLEVDIDKSVRGVRKISFSSFLK